MTTTGSGTAAGGVASEAAAFDARPRRLGRRARWVALAAAVVLMTLVAALTNRTPSSQPLDPAAAGPDGTRALAVLLTAHGVDVQRVSTGEAAARAAGGNPVTVVVPNPDLVPDIDRLARIRGRLVLFDAGDEALAGVAAGITGGGFTRLTNSDPGCDLPAATAAGRAYLGGRTYRTPGGPATAECYSSTGGPALVVAPRDGGDVVAVGDATLLTNAELASEGNAALALNLLSTHDTVVWVLPRPGETLPTGEAGRGSLASYLPDRLVAALWTVALGVLLLGLAYGRRLGRVVTEDLPVVVRAAETVEGKARLYRAARARDRAAGWLRDAALHDLRTSAGLPVDASAPELVDAVAARAGRPREDVGATLYGPAPQTDRDLVALADALDRLTAEVRRQ
ncbi:MAG: hypothetical protein JWM93_3682 [Frankiales bacterium]|nr:hypothetical protein [Frankiales bacterium]